MYNKIKFNDIQPYIRYAQLLNIRSELQFKNLKAYDCRLFFVREGSGKIIVNDATYQVNKGCLMLWQPNTEYSLLNEDNRVMKLIGFSFDFCRNHCDKTIPIPPSHSNEFREDEILYPYVISDSELFNKPIFQSNRYDLELELMQIYREYKDKLIFYENKISGMFLSVLTDLIRHGEEGKKYKNTKGNINKILTLIRERYSETLTNKIIGSELGYHPNHVNHIMVINTGVSLHQYLQEYRIGKAMDLLQTTELSISQICEAVGFKDFTHFSKYFKKKTGYTPSAFRYGK